MLMGCGGLFVVLCGLSIVRVMCRYGVVKVSCCGGNGTII